VLTGLCGGLGRYFGLDPLIFRVAFVVLALAGGTGVLLYLVGWLLIPDDLGGVAIRVRGERPRLRQFLLALLIGAGILIVLSDGFDHHWGPDFPVTLVLLAVGAAVLWSRRDRLGGPSAPPVGPPPSGPTGGGTPWPAPPPAGPTAPPAGPTAGPAGPTPGPAADPLGPATSEGVGPSSDPSAAADPLAPPNADATTTASDDTASLAVPPPALAPLQPPPTTGAAGARARTRPARPPRPRSVLVPATLSLLVLAGGVLALLGAPLAVSLAVLLLITAAAMVVGAWRGRARWLIPVAVVLGLALAAASVLDVPIEGESGDRTYRPTTVADLRPAYRVAAGQLILDLRGLDLGGRTVSVLASDGIGHLEVLVPPAATVVATGHVGAGEVRLFEESWDGTHVDKTRTSPGQDGGGRVVLRARVGIGQVEVIHAEA
jgi:phage shock protein PspC (stress-responsive transcriptional regulator)